MVIIEPLGSEGSTWLFKKTCTSRVGKDLVCNHDILLDTLQVAILLVQLFDALFCVLEALFRDAVGFGKFVYLITCLLYFSLGFTRGGGSCGMAGRDVFESLVNGRPELFKLRGMLYGLLVVEGLSCLGALIEL